jgi:hypothetical protein
MKNLKLTFRDTFSFCVEHKTISVNFEEEKRINKSINKIVHRELRNGIVYIWQLSKIEII